VEVSVESVVAEVSVVVVSAGGVVSACPEPVEGSLAEESVVADVSVTTTEVSVEVVVSDGVEAEVSVTGTLALVSVTGALSSARTTVAEMNDTDKNNERPAIAAKLATRTAMLTLNECIERIKRLNKGL